MANEQLGIKLIGALNIGLSVQSVNEGIRALSSHPSLQKLNIKINIDQSFVKSINSFIDAAKKLNSNLEAQNRVVKETITEFKNLDGSITKTTQQILANGEQIEKSRTKHDANKKAINEESKAYDEQRKTLSQLETEMNGYVKASEKVNRNKAGQINSITNTYKNADTGKTVTVNTDAEGNVNNYSKVSNYLKAEQDALKAEQEINRQREQIAKEEYNTRKALADKNLREEEQRNKNFIAALKERYTQEQAILKNQEEMEKIHYLALQQNQKREEQYAKSIADTQQKINDARNKYGNNNSAVSSLNELENKLRSISNIGDFKSPLSSLNNDLKRTISQLNEGTKHSHSFGDSLKHAFSNIALYGGIGTVLMGVQSFFREGVSYVNELNKSLTELSIVYMQGQDEVEKYGEKFHNLAMQMGITTNEIAKGAVEFARQGLNQQEMFSRMESAVKYATISNLDFSTSAKVLTATVNSMNVDIERASDVFSYLGDATASGADEVGQAMQRVGGTAGAIGVEFEKVASWIATISSNTRESAYTIGNSVKSILARMQSLKEQGFDEEDGTKVNDVAKALATIGVKLVDAQGNFRDFGDVLDEVGGKWSGLDSRTKAYIATATAGSYQSARFLALMDDYGQSVELYKGSLDSAGISTEKFNLYQESTQSHLNKLKTAMEGLWTSTFDSKTMRSVIDAATSLISSLDNIAKQFGGINTAVVIATTALLTFNRGLRMSALSAFGIDLKAVALATQIFTGSTIAARAAVFALQATMTLGLSVAIAGVVAGLTHLLNKHQEQKELNQQIAEQNKTIANSWNTQKDKVNELVATYEDLQKVTNNGSVFADQEQEDKYKKTIDDLATLMPNLVASIDEKGNKHLKSAEAIKAELDVAERLAKIENQKTVDNAESNFKQRIDEIKGYKDEIIDIQAKMAVGVGANFTPFSKTELDEFQIKILNLQQKISSATDVTKEDINGLVQSLLAVNNVKIDEGVASQLQNIVADLSLKGLNEKDIYNRSIDIKNLLINLNELKNTPDSAKSNELIAKIKEIGSSVGLTDKEVKELINSLNNVPKSKSSIDSMTTSVKTLEDALAEVEKKFDSATNTINSLVAAQKELKENHKLSADTLFDLVSKYPDLLKYVNDEKTLNRELSKAIEDERNVQKEAFKEKLTLNEQFFSNMIKGNKNIWPLVAKAYEKDYKDFKTVADAKKKTNDLLLQAIGSDWNKYFANEKLALQEVIQAPMKYRNPSPELKKQLEERAEMAKSQLAAIEAMEKPIDLSVNGNVDWSIPSDAAKSADKLTDSYSDTVEILTELQKKLKENADALDRLHNKQSSLKEGSEEYQKAVDKEISLLKEKKKLLEDGIKDPSQLVSTKITTTTKTTSDSSGDTSSSSSSSSSTGDYSDIINKNASANNVDANLIKAIIDQESSFNPKATSSAGAQGLMQLMPPTARSLGVKNSYDPAQNIAGGTKYFAGLLKQFDGDVELALLAYNAGPSRIEKWRKSGESIAALPKETQQYAAKVLGKYNSYTGNSSSSKSSTSANGVTKTTDKTGNVTKTVKTDGPTDKEKQDAVASAKKERDSIDNDLNDAYIRKLNGKKKQYENQINDIQIKIDDSKRIQETLDPNSAEWRKENDKQINLKSEIQKAKHDEKNELQYMMKALGVQSDEYDNFLKQLSAEWKDIQADKNKQFTDNITSQIDESRQRISDLDNLIEQSQNKMAQYAVGTPEYNKELNYQIELKKKQKQENDNLISSLEKLNKSENLDAVTKKNLKTILDELKLKDFTAEIKDLNEQLINSKSFPLEDKLNKLNHQLDLSKAKMKGLREGTDEYNKETKNQISIINDQIAVTKQLIDYEEAQSKNEELSASDREDHKKKLQEYTLSLYDYADAKKSLSEDYADKIIDNYKKMLQEQQKLQDAAYDKQKEAEDARHEARMNNLDDELSRFNEVINAQSKSLDRDVAAEDYQDQLSKLQKERAELDAKFSALLLDDSLEAKSKRADLQKELDAKAEEITKLQRDREITIRKDGLQDQLEDRQNAVNKEKKLEDEKNKEILKGIEDAKKKSDEYYEGLLNDEQYFYNMKQNLMSEDTVKVQNELNIIQAAYDTFFQELAKNSGVYGAKIAENLKYSIGLDENYAKNFPLSDGSGTGNVNGTGSGNIQVGSGGTSNGPVIQGKTEKQIAWETYLSNKQQAEQLTTEMRKLKTDSSDFKNKQAQYNALHAANEAYRKQYPDFPDKSYEELKNLKIYHKGGEVGVEGTSTKDWWKSFEVPAILKKGEVVLDQPRNFFDEIARNVMSNSANMYSNIARSIDFNGSKNTSKPAPIINIQIDKVEGTKEGAKIVTDSIENMLKKNLRQGN